MLTYTEPKIKVGDKIKLVNCTTSNDRTYIGSIWRIRSINGENINIIEIGGIRDGISGLITKNGPWQFEIISEDWDE